MNYQVNPPEVNSAQMLAGAGSGPMLAAATAWDGLADELSSAAASFGAVVSGLAGGFWQGPAAVAMTTAATPYVGWLTAAAGHATQASGRVRETATVFEAARAAIVHPVAVTANRARLVSLAASNWFGQNATVIADTEAAYEGMWAQDVSAMVGYHVGASEAAARLTPLQSLAKTFMDGAQRLPAALARVQAANGAYVGNLAKAQTAQVARARVAMEKDLGAAKTAARYARADLARGDWGYRNIGTGNVDGFLPRAGAAVGDVGAAVRVGTGTAVSLMGQDLAAGPAMLNLDAATMSNSLFAPPAPPSAPSPPSDTYYG